MKKGQNKGFKLQKLISSVGTLTSNVVDQYIHYIPLNMPQ